MIIKTNACTNNSEKSSTIKIGEYNPCRYSISTIWAFDNMVDKHSIYRGEHCMKKFFSSLREHVTNVINFEKKMLPLTKKGAKITPRGDSM